MTESEILDNSLANAVIERWRDEVYHALQELENAAREDGNSAYRNGRFSIACAKLAVFPKSTALVQVVCPGDDALIAWCRAATVFTMLATFDTKAMEEGFGDCA